MNCPSHATGAPEGECRMASHGKLGELLAGLEQRSKGVKDSSSDTSGSTSVTARMQHVLQLLFDDYLKTEKGEN